MGATPGVPRPYLCSRHARASKKVSRCCRGPSDLWPYHWVPFTPDGTYLFKLGGLSSDPPAVPPEDISNLKGVTFGLFALVPLALLPLAWNE